MIEWLIVLVYPTYFLAHAAWSTSYQARRVDALLIWHGRYMYGRDIAKALGMSYGSIYTVLNELVDKERVAIYQHYDGSRLKYYSTSSKEPWRTS